MAWSKSCIERAGLALAGIGAPAQAERRRIVGLHADRLIEVANGAVMVTHVEMDERAAAVRLQIFPVEPDRLAEIVQRALEIARFAMQIGRADRTPRCCWDRS